jgi:hypothetical protein
MGLSSEMSCAFCHFGGIRSVPPYQVALSNFMARSPYCSDTSSTFPVRTRSNGTPRGPTRRKLHYAARSSWAITACFASWTETFRTQLIWSQPSLRKHGAHGVGAESIRA